MNLIDIPNYEEFYQVSDCGQVYAKERIRDTSVPGKFKRIAKMKAKFLKLNTEKNGYKTVTLQKGSTPKTMKVHRLVMLAFVGHSDFCVNHIDGIKENNNLTNLEYVSVKENNVHAFKIGLKVPAYKIPIEEREKIKKMKGKVFYKDIALQYNVALITISRIMAEN